MINVSSNFRRKLAMDDRAYLEKVDLTLKDGTVLHLTNADIWGGSLSIDDSVGSDNSFTALGACVVNSLKFTINNIYDDFSDYDFMDAVAVVQIGLDDVNDGYPEYVDKGVFTVVDPTYNGSTISIVAHDNMSKFDKPYSASSLVYPADLDTIVRNLCYVCDVDLATSSLNFPRKDYVIQNRPSDEATTCREVLSWCAIIAGCYARCNVDGDLELKWFDTDVFDTASESLDGGRFDNHDPNVYVTGDDADGGVFNPWVSGDGDEYDGGSFDYSTINLINSMYSQTISVDDVVITQVKAEVKVKSDTGEAIETYTEGQSGYTVKIAPNDFITTDNAQYIVGVLGTELIGLKFRKANISHPSDPTIEAGDCAFVYDRKGNRYQILVTRTDFKVGSAQTTVCGADTPARNSATRFSEQTKSYVEVRQQLIEQKTEWEEAVEDLEDQIANADGMYETQVQQTGGGVITYMHNKPLLAESDIQIMISDVGVTVTANGTSSSPTWYGLTVDGQLIASILTTVGVNADWIHSGTLTLGGQNNTNGSLRILDASDNQIGSWNNSGVSITKGSINIGNGNFVVDTSGNVTAKSITAENSGKISQFTFTSSALIYNSGGIAGSYDRSNKDKIYIGGNTGIAITHGSAENSVVIHNGEITMGTLNIPGMIIRQKNTVTNWWETFEIYDVKRQYAWLSYDSSPSSGYFDLDLTSQSFHFYDKSSGNTWLNYDVRSAGYSTKKLDIDVGYQINISSVSGTKVTGNFTVSGGTKSRVVETDDYSNRLLYAYETPSPLFGDVGEGVIGDDGKCYVMIDSIFAETVNLSQYQVFLQKYGSGDCWVSERKSAYFIVEGTPGMSFGWELKAKQADFDQYRLEEDRDPVTADTFAEYGTLLSEHIEDIRREREVA